MPSSVGIWKAWFSLRQSLALDTHLGNLEPHWHLPDILCFLLTTKHLTTNIVTNITSTLARIGIKIVGDLWDQNQFQWTNFSPKVACLCNTSPAIRELVTQCVIRLQLSDPPFSSYEPQKAIWTWPSTSKPLINFTIPNQTIYHILLKPMLDWQKHNAI